MTSPSQKRDAIPTPLQREFDHVWNGFDRTQVRSYLGQVELDIERLRKDRDEAKVKVDELAEQLAQTQQECGKLAERIEELKVPPESLDDLDERMQRVGRLAHTQAEEVVERAQAATEKNWKETAQASIALRERYRALLKELDSHAEALHAEHRAALEETRTEVRELMVESVRRREQLDADAERKRRAIEQEFDTSVDKQHRELEKYIADQRTASKQHAERKLSEARAEGGRIVEEATAEAKRRTAEAEAVVTRVAGLSERAREQIRAADELLAGSESILEPTEDELLPAPRAEQTQEKTSSTV